MITSITFTPSRWKTKLIKLDNGILCLERKWYEIITFFLFDTKWKKQYEEQHFSVNVRKN